MAQAKNEGEGSRTAAKAYNDKTTAFAQSGRVEEQAEKAKQSLANPAEAADLKAAEKAAKAHAKGEDPAVDTSIRR
ncbi:hypothetical protein [Zavarzinia sp. CC-PAN008]|uniref:hypothetical protein n=1 Tax=Zavarzinia sp. CC-PAN008 TaxID=3243332 RepID=UPI003F748BCC